VSRVSPILRFGLLRPLVERPGLGAAIKANIGRYVRVPSFIELYGNGTAYVLGNDELVPENGTNVDVGLWVDRTGERVGVQSRTVAFGARVDDLIQWQYAAWGQAIAQNLARAQVYGVEQELRLVLGRRARLIAQATYLDARDKSDNAASRDKQIPFHARYRAYARPELVRLPLPGGIELGAYADVELRMGSYEDPANLVDLRTRALVGAGLLVGWPRAGLRLTASGANLTGSDRRDITDWALPGRAFFLALAYAPVVQGDTGSAFFDPRYGQ
jgi:outer membrane cobalamin receptor